MEFPYEIRDNTLANGDHRKLGQMKFLADANDVARMMSRNSDHTETNLNGCMAFYVEDYKVWVVDLTQES